MFVSGFTIVRNAILFDYPITESILSLLPLVDELIVAVGQSRDATRQAVTSIDSPKLRIVDTVWDESARLGGTVLAQQTNLALDECQGDWCFYLQADEVIHEHDYDRIRKAMASNLKRTRVEGLGFRYHHFRASYGIRDPLPYRFQTRIVRRSAGPRSYGDACGFLVDGRKPRSASTGAWMYHYGYVKPPPQMTAKMNYFSSLYDGNYVEPAEAMNGEAFEWDLRTCEAFRGTHPEVMQARIGSADWEIPIAGLIPRWRNPWFWNRLAHKNTRTFRNWYVAAKQKIAG